MDGGIELDNEKIIEEKLRTENRLRDGASWFYWIAGLSLVNSLLVFFESDWSFISGLSVTKIIDYTSYFLSIEFGNIVSIIGLILNLIIIGFFIVLGVFANKGRNWSFIVGFIFYGLDTILLVFMADFISIAFHLFALYSIFRGYQANKQLQELNEDTHSLKETQLKEA